MAVIAVSVAHWPSNPEQRWVWISTLFYKVNICQCFKIQHQENSELLEWLEPAPPAVLALQHTCWAYLDIPKSSTSAGGENVLVPALKAGPSVAGTNEIVISLFAHYKKKQITIRCNEIHSTTMWNKWWSNVHHYLARIPNLQSLPRMPQVPKLPHTSTCSGVIPSMIEALMWGDASRGHRQIMA